MTLEVDDLYLDYAKHRLTAETIDLLVALARRAGVEQRRDAMFAGEKINVTEQRAVLHVALRAPADESIVVDGVDVVPEVHEVLDRMGAFAEQIRSGAWTGHTGRPIRNVVNIGIGGSDLGPAMAYEALRDFTDRDLSFRFVSNIDGTDFWEAVHGLDPAETLFIIVSKTFTTLETMTNAADGPRLGAGRARRRGRGGPALRGRVDQRRGRRGLRHRHGQHVRVLGLGRRPLLVRLGGRPVADDLDRRRRGSARCWPASTPWTSTSAPRPSRRTCRC